MDQQRTLANAATASEPVIGSTGEWGSAGGMAVREALSWGSLDSAMEVLDGLDGRAIANLVQEVGFTVSESAVECGRGAVLADVRSDMAEAVERRIDGLELRSKARVNGGRPVGFAAKDIKDGFRGNREAVLDVQKVLAASGVKVDFLGDAVASGRGAMQCIAAQAMQAGVQGFSFDGVPGKYEVSCRMHEVVELHQVAAGVVAVESVRAATDVWRKGEKVGDISHWVPDSVQRALQGSLSENSAWILSRAVNEGTIAHHATHAGLHAITLTLAEHGLSVNAPTIAQQAESLGLTVVEPDRQRGKYVGPVVGVDHCAALVKYARANSVEVPFAALKDGQPHLQLGDVARVEFNKGAMVVNKVAERENRGVGR